LTTRVLNISPSTLCLDPNANTTDNTQTLLSNSKFYSLVNDPAAIIYGRFELKKHEDYEKNQYFSNAVTSARVM